MIELRLKHVCALLAIFFGWVALRYGFKEAVFIGALGAAGWFVGRFLEGEVDLPVLNRSRRDFTDLE